MPAAGRRALAREDTRPGQTLALGVLANLPIGLGFVLVPLFASDGGRAVQAFLPIVRWLTPVLAIWGLVIFARMGERRAHRAARIGALLCGTALVLWALVIFSPAARGSL